METKTMEKPEKVVKQDLVEIMIDHDMTDGGIRVNEQLFVGKVKVTAEQAEDLQRIQSEYFETKKKLSNPDTFIHTKSDITKATRFLADPSQYPQLAQTPQFRQYGLLDPRDWNKLTEGAKKMFLDRRMQMYGY